MANETTKLTARRGLFYGGVQVKRGDEFDARAQDVEHLTSGDRPMAIGGKAKGRAAATTTDEKPAAKPAADERPSGKLPDDFPGLAALTDAGITTYGGVRKLDEAALVDLPGIGEATAKKIIKAAK